MTPRARVTTLFELVDESAAIDPDAEALVFADGERLTVGARGHPEERWPWSLSPRPRT